MKKCYEGIAAAIAEETGAPMFGVMGDGNMSLWAAIAALGRNAIYSARHEAGAVAMADGYFRATGELGLATVTCGPGLTQVGTSLMAAARNRSKIVVVTGEIPAGAKNKLQVMDQRRFIEACEARFVTVTSVDNAPDEIAEAFFLARQGSRPVVLNLPIDIQERSLEWEWDYRPSAGFVNTPKVAAEADLERLAALLNEAERPVIVAGRGARVAGARDEIVALADRAGALLATSLQAKGLFADHPYVIGIAGSYSAAPAEHLFQEADLILAVGAEFGYFTSEGGMLAPFAKVARIDVAPPPLEIGVVPGDYVRGDAKATAAALLQKVEKKEGFRTKETRQFLASGGAGNPAEFGEHHPRHMLASLARVIPDNARLFCGGGHLIGFVAMHLAVPPDVDTQFSSQWGAVGQTIPVAVGMGAATPDRPFIVIEGDGSVMMNLQELETAARHQVQMVVIIWNDGGFGAEVHKLAAKGLDGRLAQWPNPDFVAIARAFGGDGELLADPRDLGEAVERGLRKKGLYLVEVRVSPLEKNDAYKKLYFGIPNAAPLIRREEARL